MDTLLHILDRSFLHIMMAAAVYIACYIGAEWLHTKKPTWYRLGTPAVLGCYLIMFREAYDVHNGQPLVKAYTDALSWGLGMALGIWGLYRWEKRGGFKLSAVSPTNTQQPPPTVSNFPET